MGDRIGMVPPKLDASVGAHQLNWGYQYLLHLRHGETSSSVVVVEVEVDGQSREDNMDTLQEVAVVDVDDARTRARPHDGLDPLRSAAQIVARAYFPSDASSSSAVLRHR